MDRYAKAVVGALVAGLAVIETPLALGQHLTAATVVAALIAALTALATVWVVPNAQAVTMRIQSAPVAVVDAQAVRTVADPHVATAPTNPGT